jgi:hypothetical protein
MKKSLFSAIAVGLCMTANVMAQVPSYVPSNGLVGWWPFNGNAIDESGNGNNGTVNGATLTTDRFGNANKAYSFDGTGDYIDCGNSTSVNILGSISISAWINAIDFFSENGIISKMGSYDLITGAENTVPPLDKIRWLQAGGFLYTNSIQPNNWLNVVAILDLNSNIKSIYINGSLVATQSVNLASITPSNENLYIGAHQPLVIPDWSFHGSLDDIGIWNRALTQQEITDLYNGTLGISNLSENSIYIYPNPTNDHITIDAGDLTTMNGYSIRIEDAQGQQVFQNAVNQQQFYIDITSWGGNGLYFVRIIDPQGNTVDSKKIVLQ